MTEMSHDSSSSFPSATREEWSERVREDLGIDDPSRFVETLPEDLEVEALYGPENTEPPLPRIRREVGDWESWPIVDLELSGPPREVVDELGSLGAGGVWARPSPSIATSQVTDLLVAVKERGLAFGMLGGAPAASLLAAAWRREVRDLRGSLGIDPYPGPVPVETSFLTAAAAWARDEAPGMRPFLLSSRIPEEVGAGAVHELAWLAAGSAELLRRLAGEGMEIQEEAEGLVWSVPVGRDVHLQIAKLRAARVLWAMILETAGVSLEDAPLRVAARTSWRTKSRWDAKTNLLRETVEAFAAVTGGCDSLTCRAFDGERTELGRRLRLTLPLVLREEGRLGRVADPAGGSWYMESLTRTLAEEAWTELQRIEEEGGLAASLSSGSVTGRLREAAKRRETAIRRRREPVVGISMYPTPEEEPAHRRGDLRPGFPSETWEELVRGFEGGNRFGELVGESPTTSTALPESWSDPAPFEALRDRAADRGGGPRAVLVGVGSLRELSGPSSAARQLLVAGGFRVEEPEPFDTASAARDFLVHSEEDLVVVVLPRRTETGERRRIVESVRPAVSGPLAIQGSELFEGADAVLPETGDAVEVLETLWEEVRR
ncbi:MAG: methylmalonyl-CoA mutase family protein [Thermoanaerobaculia bacterium]|nr:methylmalonyl-CoA mutase family protein [Thermoanaerobaculia bacterium]